MDRQNTFFLTFPEGGISTEIFLQKDFFQDPAFVHKLKALGSRAVLVTESSLENILAGSVLSALKAQNLSVSLITIPDGEKNKTRETKAFIEDKLLELKMGRDTVLIALGGGVVSDMVGFVASTYCRGIPYVILPTTLLSMVDASIGGKTAVNVGPYKNAIGSFYPPTMVVIDPEFLKSLPEREWRNGLAEIIKYGLISSSAILDRLETGLSEVESLISLSVETKCRIVQQDPKEKGLRRILNFGHTVGHAIESLENYTIGHGEAVAIGMLMESFISMKLGYLSRQEFCRIEELMQQCGFSLALSPHITLNKLKKLMALDKKSAYQKPRFVVLNGIGNTVSFNEHFCTDISDDILTEAFSRMQQYASV